MKNKKPLSYLKTIKILTSSIFLDPITQIHEYFFIIDTIFMSYLDIDLLLVQIVYFLNAW